MTPALLRYVILAVGLGLLPSPVEAFSQERDCPVPERFYAFDPSLTKTVKALVSGRDPPPWGSRQARPAWPGLLVWPPRSRRGSRLLASR
jgi:hypothetical protein